MMPSRPCLQSARAFIQLQLTSAMSLIRKKGSDQSNRLASSGQPHRSPISNVGRTWHFLNTVNLIQQKPQQRCEQPSMDRVAYRTSSAFASGSFLYSAEILSVVASGLQAHQPLFSAKSEVAPILLHGRALQETLRGKYTARSDTDLPSIEQ